LILLMVDYACLSLPWKIILTEPPDQGFNFSTKLHFEYYKPERSLTLFTKYGLKTSWYCHHWWRYLCQRAAFGICSRGVKPLNDDKLTVLKPAVLATPTLKLRAIYSRRLNSAQETAKDLSDVDLYSTDSGPGKDFADLLARADIDAVIIAYGKFRTLCATLMLYSF